MNKLHVFVTLVGAFIIANTACQKENSIQQEELKKKVLSMRDSIGNDTLRPPCDSFPHDSFPHDTFPHDSFPWPPHDTFPRPPHDTFPHDSFPYLDSIGLSRS